MERTIPWTFTIALAGLLVLGSAAHAGASPTMVRLGYAGCSACHLAPQGAGLLTDYGKGIDIAQSLKVSEYIPRDPTESPALRYDLRVLALGSITTEAPSGAQPSAPPWLRTYFRGSAALGAQTRLASTVIIEAPTGDISRLWQSRPTVDVLGVWEYRPSDAFTLAVARDRLPRGVELGETRTVLQDGDSERYPAQLRAFVSASRFLVTAFVYGADSSQARDRHARGGGVLGEARLYGDHVVLGISARRALEDTLHRQIVGGYARMGFGRWGILAEHELTIRTNPADGRLDPRRYAGYTQVFFVPAEWLVASVIVEQADDAAAIVAHGFRWRPEMQARLSKNFTITASVRTDTARRVSGSSRMYLLQLAVKTVQ